MCGGGLRRHRIAEKERALVRHELLDWSPRRQTAGRPMRAKTAAAKPTTGAGTKKKRNEFRSTTKDATE
jgi:hypothetical protein